MEAAAAATGTGGSASADASSSRANNNNGFKWHNKLDKKPRSSKNHHNPSHQSKRHNVAQDSPPPPPPTLPHHGTGMKKQYLFGNFGMGLREDSSSSGFGRVFPENEAEAAALLLMELSRGLLHA